MRTVDTYGDVIIFPGSAKNCQGDYNNLSISENLQNFHFRTNFQFLQNEHQISGIVFILTKLDESCNQSSIFGRNVMMAMKNGRINVLREETPF